jgi:hypothetical protein
VPSSANTEQRIRFRNAVLESDLPPSAKLVAIVYESYAGVDTDQVWVTPENLRRRTSLQSDDTIIRHRKKLVDGGWLELVAPATYGYCARYRLTVPHPQAAANVPVNLDNLTDRPGDGLNLHHPESESAVGGHRESVPNSNHNNDRKQCDPPDPPGTPFGAPGASDDEASSSRAQPTQVIDVEAAKREARRAAAAAPAAFRNRRS